MARAFTCNDRLGCQHPSLPHMHMQHPDIASPFVRLHPSVTHSHPPPSVTSYNDCDVAVPSWETVIDDTSAASLPPCLTGVSGTKTFHSAIEVTTVPMEEHTSTPMPLPATRQDVREKHDEGGGDFESARASGVKSSPSSNSKKSRSRASSTSRRTPRSTSSSTAGRSVRATRRSSIQLASRAATSSQVPSSSHSQRNSLQMSQEKRDGLLALHRDCCRLFSGEGSTSNADMSSTPSADLPYGKAPSMLARSYTAPIQPAGRYGRTLSSQAASPPMSPILQSQRSPPFIPVSDYDGDISDEELSTQTLRRPSVAQSDPERQLYTPVPATVIDWTSPSTRRREYEKIDRSNRGLRRVWRRLAPQCFQSADARTPFFEEDQDGKGNYEGSVRRFRMDIPDEKEERDLEAHEGSLKSVSRKVDKKGSKWSCFA